MLPSVGFPEMIFILVLVLLLFGAKRLPEIGASMGKGIREFKKSISDVDKAIKNPDDQDKRYLDRASSTEAEPVVHNDADTERMPKRLIT